MEAVNTGGAEALKGGAEVKGRLLPMALATFLILAVLLVGVLTDFIGTSPLVADEPVATVVLTTEMAPVGETLVMLTLADVAVAPDAVANSEIYVAVLGTSTLGLLILLTFVVMRSRSSGRQVSFSGWVRSRGTAIV